MFHAFYTVVRVMWQAMKGFSVHTGWDVGRRNAACYWTLLETQWLRKRHITIRPMNPGLNKFQTDYILARETFSPKTHVLSMPSWTNSVMQLLVTQSLFDRVEIELKLYPTTYPFFQQLTPFSHRYLHSAGTKGKLSTRSCAALTNSKLGLMSF